MKNLAERADFSGDASQVLRDGYWVDVSTWSDGYATVLHTADWAEMRGCLCDATMVERARVDVTDPALICDSLREVYGYDLPRESEPMARQRIVLTLHELGHYSEVSPWDGWTPGIVAVGHEPECDHEECEFDAHMSEEELLARLSESLWPDRVSESERG